MTSTPPSLRAIIAWKSLTRRIIDEDSLRDEVGGTGGQKGGTEDGEGEERMVVESARERANSDDVVAGA